MTDAADIQSLSTKSERSIVQSCVRFLRKLPHCKVVKWHGNPYSQGGQPDLFVVYHGLAVLVEVKRDGKGPNARQLIELRQWADAKAICAVVHNVDELRRVMAIAERRLKEWGVYGAPSEILDEQRDAKEERRRARRAAGSVAPARRLDPVEKQRRIAARLREGR